MLRRYVLPYGTEVDLLNMPQSVDLNPKFSKSWGRLASAYLELGSWKAAIEYYEVALSCLPKSSLNASEITQKKQYDAGIKKAKEMLEPKDEPEWGQPRLSVVNANSEEGRNSPWKKVTKLREEMLRKGLTEKNHKSSVGYIPSRRGRVNE